MIQPEYEVLIPRIPLERMGTPQDVAGAICFSARGRRLRHRQRTVGDRRQHLYRNPPCPGSTLRRP